MIFWSEVLFGPGALFGLEGTFFGRGALFGSGGTCWVGGTFWVEGHFLGRGHFFLFFLNSLLSYKILKRTRIEKITIISINHSKILLFYSQYSTHYKIVKFYYNSVVLKLF